MADLPVLSDSAKRMLALQWEALREKHKLTDEDLSGYDRKRQQLTQISAQWPRHDPRHLDPRSAAQVARWLGVTSSVNAAEERFRRAGPDMGTWCASGAGYETFAASLDSVKRDIVAELESIWKGRSAVTDRWFEQTCKPDVEKALSVLVKGRIAQARQVEMNSLDGKAWAEARTRAMNGLFKANPNGSTEPKAAQSTRTDAGPAASGTDGNGADQRATIDAFIWKLAGAGRKITRKNIWTVAGYRNATEFERFQRGDIRTTKSAAAAFKRVLGMMPEAFIGLLDKKPTTK
jgi:hypothetical protein